MDDSWEWIAYEGQNKYKFLHSETELNSLRSGIEEDIENVRKEIDALQLEFTESNLGPLLDALRIVVVHMIPNDEVMSVSSLNRVLFGFHEIVRCLQTIRDDHGHFVTREGEHHIGDKIREACEPLLSLPQVQNISAQLVEFQVGRFVSSAVALRMYALQCVTHRQRQASADTTPAFETPPPTLAEQQAATTTTTTSAAAAAAAEEVETGRAAAGWRSWFNMDAAAAATRGAGHALHRLGQWELAALSATALACVVAVTVAIANRL